MTVHCPHCATAYLLPDHLLGPRGARVRCPSCRRPFVVLRDDVPATAATPAPTPAVGVESTAPAAALAAGAPEPATAEAEAGADAAAEAPESVAAGILEALAARLGGRLDDARARGRVLAELGPELMGAYDDFCARAGAEAPREVFRSVLRERWGVDLFGGR